MNKIVNSLSNYSIDVESYSHITRGSILRGNIHLGKDVSISSGKLYGNISIGDYTNLNGENSVIGDVTIGKYCAIAPRVRIRTTNHPTNKASIHIGLYNDLESDIGQISDGTTTIGNDVWICADAKILSDVTIGDGAIIGADSVVVDDVEPYSIVAGNPAKHVGWRFDESTRATLQEISWWNWERECIEDNVEFFEADLDEIDDIWSLID
jgi:virginiamycin A acetyltransferase